MAWPTDRRQHVSPREQSRAGNRAVRGGPVAPEAERTDLDQIRRTGVTAGVATGQRGPGQFFRKMRTFDSLQDREFRWFYLAMLGQMAAMNMQLLVRGALTYHLTGSYAALGLVGLANALPMLFLSPFGGVMADRLPKRTVLILGQAASLLIALVVAALLFADVLIFEYLVLTAVVQWIVMSLMMPSRQAMIPDLVGNEKMMNAISLNMAGMNTMRLFAPAGTASSSRGGTSSSPTWRWRGFTWLPLSGCFVSPGARPSPRQPRGRRPARLR